MLEKAKMVEILKGQDRNRPQTTCRITPSGRKRYLEYLSTLEQVVRDAAKSTNARIGLQPDPQPGAFARLKFFCSFTLHCKVTPRNGELK